MCCKFLWPCLRRMSTHPHPLFTSDVLKGGVWVQADQGDKNELRHSMTKQILSHGINHFWRQEAIFVTFAA